MARGTAASAEYLGVTFRAEGLRPGKRLTFSPLVPKDMRVRRF